MNKKDLHLVIASFRGAEQAASALDSLSEGDRNFPVVVILVKDDQGRVTFEDAGRTPGKQAAKGALLGAVAGVLSGGASLALGAVGGLVAHRRASKKQVEKVASLQLNQVAASMGPNSSAIVGIGPAPLKPSVIQALESLGASVYEAVIPADVVDRLDDYSDEHYERLLEALAAKTGGEKTTDVPYPRIYVVVNPASGKPQPVLHILNKNFHKFGIQWEVGLTHKYGDATEMARQAAQSGEYDLIVGYGGDGAQHEIANGIMQARADVVMGVLPGGTGNGFATELGVPHDLDAAVRVLCTSHNVRRVDIAQYDEDAYFIQRLFTGIEPEEQTSREDKDKYGTFAYLMRDVNRYKSGEMADVPYRLTIDGQVIDIQGYKCYVVNSGMAGTGLAISKQFKIDDGYLDVFMLSSSDRASTEAAMNRFLGLSNDKASMYYWRGQEIVIDAAPDQPVWTDGEYTGRTPVHIKILPRALTVAAP